jgi:ABC-type sugar transport system ATPase subunit
LEGVDLDVADGELLVLVGPSGSGKTTLLRLVAGLDQPTAGSVRLGGKDLAGVPPHKRNVALVFQNLALYGHLTVADNLAFGLNHERRSGRIGEAAEMLGIDHLLDRMPAELSGGEQQRVALGRAIVRQPAALLLDEPLSSLDAPVRRSLRRELRRLQRQLGVPTIYVTHDQAEALALGDRIAVLDRGRLQQVGSPDEIYNQPANVRVAKFFGPQGMNIIDGYLTSEGGPTKFRGDTRPESFQFDVPADVAPKLKAYEGGKVLCGFRPEDVEPDTAGELKGEITGGESLGHATYVCVRLPGLATQLRDIIVRQTDRSDAYSQGVEVHLRLNPEGLHWFEGPAGTRLPKA